MLKSLFNKVTGSTTDKFWRTFANCCFWIIPICSSNIQKQPFTCASETEIYPRPPQCKTFHPNPRRLQVSWIQPWSDSYPEQFPPKFTANTCIVSWQNTLRKTLLDICKSVRVKCLIQIRWFYHPQKYSYGKSDTCLNKHLHVRTNNFINLVESLAKQTRSNNFLSNSKVREKCASFYIYRIL